MGKPSVNALVEAVRAAGAAQPRPVGPDWMTAREVAQVLGLSKFAASTRLNKLLGEGKVERVVSSGKAGGIVVYWRFKP